MIGLPRQPNQRDPDIPKEFLELERHELFRMIWTQSVNGKALVDENGYFLRANPSFCAATEYTEAELQQMTFQQITHPDDVGFDVASAKRAARGVPYVMRKRYLTKTGKIQWVALSVNPFMDDDGNFRFYFSQVAELDASAVKEGKDNGRFISNRWLVTEFFRRNWHWLGAIFGAVGYMAAEALKALQ